MCSPQNSVASACNWELRSAKLQNTVRMQCSVRAIMIFVLLAMILLPLSTRMYAGANVWTARGPEGGFTGRALIDPQDPRTIYVSTGGSLFRSTNAARVVKESSGSGVILKQAAESFATANGPGLGLCR